MFILISYVLLCFPTLSFSSLQTYPLSRPLPTRPQNLSRRLHQPITSDDGDIINNLSYDQNAWSHYDSNPKLGTTYHPQPDVPLLRPEVKRFYDHGGEDFHHADDNYNVAGNTGQEYHNKYHGLPPKPFYVAVKTNDEHNDILSKLGFLAIVKLLLTKFKTFWFIKLGLFLLFVIKVPLFLFKIALKFLFILKFAKLLKIIIIPSLVPLILLPLLPFFLLLLPLLLIPLAPLLFIPFLLPLLLPLLLLLPIPIFAHHRPFPSYEHRPPQRPSATDAPETEEEKAQRSWKGVPSIHSLDELIFLTRRVMESQQCMEKLACDIGGSHTPTVLASTITRLLEMSQSLAPQDILERLRSYTRAFKLGTGQRRNCASEFLCSPPQGMLPNVDITM